MGTHHRHSMSTKGTVTIRPRKLLTNRLSAPSNDSGCPSRWVGHTQQGDFERDDFRVLVKGEGPQGFQRGNFHLWHEDLLWWWQEHMFCSRLRQCRRCEEARAQAPPHSGWTH